MNRPDTTNQKRTLVFATNNPHKLDEMRQIVGDAFVLYSLADIGCKDDIPENEETLEGNALAKARWIKSRYGYDCFADDTGLEVEALGGAPGVRSARYASECGHDSAANMKLLLSNMADKENRNARFRTVIALIMDGREHTFEGIVDGSIADTPSGTAGFGYDPVFVPDGYNRTFAELSAEQKNAVSHRSRASKAMMAFLSTDSEKTFR